MNFKEACIAAKHPQDHKLARGYGNIYDLILDKFDNPTICELGIGGGTSHCRWSFLTDNNVIGIELKQPDDDNGRIALENFAELSKDNLDLYWGCDAYSTDSVNTIKNKYGKLDIVINDSKHRQDNFINFKIWEDAITNGILIQEEIGRFVNDRADPQFEDTRWTMIRRALEQGWRVWNFSHNRDMIKGEYHYRANTIGVYYKDDSWDSVFNSLTDYEVTVYNVEDYYKRSGQIK